MRQRTGPATMISSYDPTLVTLSVAIAILAAYTALELGDRASLASRRLRVAWISVAALAMGGGIWSMHFVGMMAVRSPGAGLIRRPGRRSSPSWSPWRPRQVRSSGSAARACGRATC